MFNFFSRVFQSFSKSKQIDRQPPESPKKQELEQQESRGLTQEEHISRLTDDQRIIVRQAHRYRDLINESIDLCLKSNNPETKITRLELAKGKLAELKVIVSAHSYINLQQIEETEDIIKKLEKEYVEKKYYTGIDLAPYVPHSTKALGISDDSSIIKGYRFSATMNLRTPAHILRMHGKSVLKNDPLLDVPIRRDQGIWLPETFPIFIGDKEIKFPSSTMASEIGPIPADGGKYLDFLLCVRSIAESEESIDDRIDRMRKEIGSTYWQDIVIRTSGLERVIGRLFPYFLSTISKIPYHSLAALEDKGLSTPKKILATSDDELLSIKGIGPARLLIIKEHCRETPNYDHKRVDHVKK